jgi:hypothetical protein
VLQRYHGDNVCREFQTATELTQIQAGRGSFAYRDFSRDHSENSYVFFAFPDF